MSAGVYHLGRLANRVPRGVAALRSVPEFGAAHCRPSASTSSHWRFFKLSCGGRKVRRIVSGSLQGLAITGDYPPGPCPEGGSMAVARFLSWHGCRRGGSFQRAFGWNSPSSGCRACRGACVGRRGATAASPLHWK